MNDPMYMNDPNSTCTEYTVHTGNTTGLLLLLCCCYCCCYCCC
jgi:hypothetical protein